MNITPTNHVKVCVIGSAGVGKTCIATRFVKGEFKGSTLNTIGVAFLSKDVRVDMKTFKLHIWDTAGQDRTLWCTSKKPCLCKIQVISHEYQALIPMYYRGAHAAIIVYDITDENSYKSLSGWVDELRYHCQQDIVLTIVGNKCDLMYKRRVSYQDAQIFAKCLSASYWETSAKTGVCIDDLFTDICRRLAPKASLPSRRSVEKDLAAEPSIKLGTEDQSNVNKRKKCCRS